MKWIAILVLTLLIFSTGVFSQEINVNQPCEWNTIVCFNSDLFYCSGSWYVFGDPSWQKTNAYSSTEQCKVECRNLGSRCLTPASLDDPTPTKGETECSKLDGKHVLYEAEIEPDTVDGTIFLSSPKTQLGTVINIMPVYRQGDIVNTKIYGFFNKQMRRCYGKWTTSDNDLITGWALIDLDKQFASNDIAVETDVAFCENLNGKYFTKTLKIDGGFNAPYYTTEINSAIQIVDPPVGLQGKVFHDVSSISLYLSGTISYTSNVVKCYGKFQTNEGPKAHGYVYIDSGKENEFVISSLEGSRYDLLQKAVAGSIAAGALQSFAQSTDVLTFYPDPATIPEVGLVTKRACSSSYSRLYKCTIDRAEVSDSVPVIGRDDYFVALCKNGVWDKSVDSPDLINTHEECMERCKTDSDFSANCAEPELYAEFEDNVLEISMNEDTPIDQIQNIVIKKGSDVVKTCTGFFLCFSETLPETQDTVYTVEATLKDKTKITGQITKPSTPEALCKAKKGRCVLPNLNSIAPNAVFSKEDCKENMLCSIPNKMIGSNGNEADNCQKTLLKTWCENYNNGYCAETPEDCIHPFEVAPQILGVLIKNEVQDAYPGRYLILTFSFLDEGNRYNVIGADMFVQHNNERINFKTLGCKTEVLRFLCEFGIDMIKLPSGTVRLNYEAEIVEKGQS
ncbi:MAG: hypothetical protein HY513_04860 [Candidatus Aenigmarchaeota archaeon]|nr:hypothetical protein [Candidatus Aenigmarchaeota archaeon]